MSSIRERLLGKSKRNSSIRDRLELNSSYYKQEYNDQLSKRNNIQKDIQKNTYEKGVQTTVTPFSTQRNILPIQEQTEITKNKRFEVTAGQDKLGQNKSIENKYQEIKKSNEYKNQMKQLEEQSNEVGYAKYNYDKQRIAEDDIGWYDKSIGRLTGGIGSLFDYNGGLIKNENGDLEYLPTFNQMKHQKVKENYKTGIGRFVGDVLYESGKIAGSTLINQALPGVGSTMYFGKMFVDSTNQAVSDGYDTSSATMYGLVNVGLEYGVGKVLGSATKGLTGGKTSEYEKLLKETFTNITKKPKIANILANAGSEATEEFVQEYLDNISKLLILDKNTNIKDYASVFLNGDVLSDALYSAAIGGVTGGIIGTATGKDTNVENKDVNLYKTFKEELEETKKNTTNKETINKIDTIISNINSNINNNSNVNTNVDTITSQINEYETLKEQNKLTSEQEIELNELKNQLNAIQNQNTDTSTSIKEEANLPTVQDIVNQEKSRQSGINLPVYNQQSNVNNSDKAILPTVNDFNSSNINIPTSDIKVDMAKINPEILNDIKGFKLGDPSIESYKGSYIKTMLNEVGIKVPTAMNYVSEVRPDMSFTTTKDLTRQQYSSIGNALQKLRSVDVTSVNNANYSIPIGNYQYVKSSNANINELRRTASMYLNNTARSNNTIKLLENIIKDRNYIIRFNPNITNEQGVPVNGLITKENGKTIIELNPNADNYVEFLVVHEITHDIATKEMKELILDYAKQDPEFEKSLESLKERYKTNDVSDEVVADVCGELFGNREFIQSVVEKKPNIFKKILNNIRKLAEKIKGTGANEYVNFVENLKEMWEDAYYSNRSNIKDKMFSIQQDSNGNKFVNVDTDQDIFDGVDEKDYNKIAKMYITDYLIGNTRLGNNDSVEINKKTSKKYTNPGKKQENFVEKMKLTPELKNVLGIATLRENSIAKKTNSKFANWEYYDFEFKLDGKTFKGNINIGITDKGKYLYEINNVKKTSGITGTSLHRPTGFSANNIPQSGNNVNSGTSSATKYSIPINKNNTQELENSSFYLEKYKQKQLDIIKSNNPVNDDYHTWIRNVEDIKTLEETINDSDWIDYDKYNPDLSRQDIENAIDSGKITVYSSYPIKQGIFVSPSKIEAESYSSNGKVYSKEVNINDVAWIDPTQGQYAKVYDILPTKYSQNAKEWNDYLKENFPSSGTKTKMSDIKLPVREDIESSSKKSKILNPNEISKLTKEDANTTPILPKRESANKVNDGNSHFAKNIKDKVNMLNVEQKAEILSKEDVRYYDKVTNKESLEKAFKKINDGGSSETLRWVKQDSKNANATDVAEGWILLKQYADNGDYDSMVEVAKKMREIGTTAGQTVQAFNIMERMTPEGMVKYAQSELSEAYDKMVKNKSKEWIDKYREDFDLKPDEVKFIMDTMQEVQNMEDGYDKRVKLAEIQKLMTDKLPPEKGAKIRSWMRISMLFNPKTQVRNVAGNALIMPVNSFSDLFSSYADKLIAKKTGVRTTGTTNVKAMLKGIKKGVYEATNDYKKGINTKDMEGNRFEISDGKSFSEKNLMGKTLNRTESLLNYVMDVGDRVFSEAAFENSLQNQLVLNNTTEITQEMIDIAHQEALSRTWNDNNNYTRFVLGVRKGLNKLNVNGYGLGDILIPFAKTPANLTKAIVDYSPAGLVSAINKGINLKRSLANGQYTATMQHEFVQSLGKATAGTMLYILGIALAKAGITSGDSDDDKDTANFLKNTLGINSYSIKIGGKSFTYDWAQPLAAPLSITANVVNSKSGDSKALLEGIIGSLDTAGSILLEQSFLQSINDVLNDNDGVVSGIINEILELPARAVPTFSKQIADLVDGTQRTSFEYGKPIQSAVNSIKAKIPFISKTLNPTVDTMGREIQKYGGKNNIFNVFLNPANVSTENISESAEEIYRLYKETGETDVMPRVAPYYINQKGEKIMMTGKDRVEYQKISGEIIEDNIKKLINNVSYSNMSDSDKANVVKDIVNYSYNIAKKDVLGLELSNTYQKAYEYSEIGDIGDYYTFKESIDNTDKDTKKASITKFLIDSDLTNEQLAYLYGNYYSSDKVLNALVQSNIPIKEYIKFNSETFESDYYTNGKTVPNSRKNKVIKYINSLNLSIPQKAMLIKMEYSSFKQYDNQIVKYVNNIDCSSYDKKVILKTIGFTSYDKDIINTINSKNISVEEKTKELEELGFKVRNGRVYTK
jgi:hypothetical protein